MKQSITVIVLACIVGVISGRILGTSGEPLISWKRLTLSILVYAAVKGIFGWQQAR